MIQDVHLTPLKVIADERGAVLHMLKHTDDVFTGFGEVYFSTIMPGQRKAWRRHQQATSQIAAPIGLVRIVLCDQRAESATSGVVSEVEIGESNYQLLTIPPNIWYALQNIGTTAALLANCSSTTHEPALVERLDLESPVIPYVWRD